MTSRPNLIALQRGRVLASVLNQKFATSRLIVLWPRNGRH